MISAPERTTPREAGVIRWDETDKKALIDHVFKALLKTKNQQFKPDMLALLRDAQRELLPSYLQRELTTVTAVPWLTVGVMDKWRLYIAEKENAEATLAKMRDALVTLKERQTALEAELKTHADAPAKVRELTADETAGLVNDALEKMPLAQLQAVVARRQAQQEQQASDRLLTVLETMSDKLGKLEKRVANWEEGD